MLEMRANNDQIILDLVVMKLIKSAMAGDAKTAFKLLDLYVLAKKYEGSDRSEEEEDLDAARRILDLDPRFFSDVADGKDAISEGHPNSLAVDRTDDNH